MINTDRLLTTFIDLLNINSPSKKEGNVAEFVTRSLREMGLSVTIDKAGEAIGGETGNIIATLPGTGSNGHRILLCSHMDTVAPTDGIRVIRDGDIIRQEGAAVLGADDKGGIACILEGLRTVVESGLPHGQIQAVIVVAEEIGLFGSKNLDMSLVNSEFGYVFDSGQPVGHLVSSAPTHDNILATYTGRAAHAGVCPEDGISAIQAASMAISRMKLGRVDSETTANVGVISGGTARNIIPEKCEVKAEARSRDEAKLDRQVTEMRQACESAAREVGAKLSLEITREYWGYQHREDAPLMRFALDAAAKTGLNPDLVAHGGGSDCNILNANGLPCAVVGVGYEKIHTADEFIAVPDLVACAEFAAALISASAR